MAAPLLARRVLRMNLGRVSVVAVAVGCALVSAAVAANHALTIQVVGAAAGAAMTTGGVALAVSFWSHRRTSELRHLLTGVGFFLACVGVFTLLAGAGLYH